MFRHSRRLIIVSSLATLVLVSLPTGRALAHGADPVMGALAGSLAWGFMAFGIAVIVAVSFVLLTGKAATATPTRAADFAQLTGFAGYVAKIRLFSRNARLYMVHVVGMDVIYGTWAVLFNLYLLAAGFDITFIGLRILLASMTSALFSVPAGFISDRIGRKLSFVLGDGMGALMSLIAISTANPTLILATAVIGGAFGALHGVAEPAFMAENSEDHERVHLFSVSSGTRTAAAIIGSALAGLVPMLFAGADAVANITLYRTVAYIGIGGWFASLIPAVMLRQTGTAQAATQGLRDFLDNIKNLDRIWRLTVPEVLIALGAGFTLPLMNVFFKEGIGSSEVEIGATFAAGQAFLVVGAFLAPLLVARIGKVRSVVYTRLAAIPFILFIAFSPDISSSFATIFTIAGLSHIARLTMTNMASPVRSAFAMEILVPGERGTQVGIQQGFAGALSGLAAFFGAQMMSAGDFRTPFLLMAVIYLIANLLFWYFFAGNEDKVAPVSAAVGAEATGAD